MVTQEVQLFQASVRDNLTFFDSGITDARILTTLQELGLNEWLARLPNGLNTESNRAMVASQRVRHNCWPSLVCSWPTPAWSSWMKPPRAGPCY